MRMKGELASLLFLVSVITVSAVVLLTRTNIGDILAETITPYGDCTVTSYAIPSAGYSYTCQSSVCYYEITCSSSQYPSAYPQYVKPDGSTSTADSGSMTQGQTILFRCRVATAWVNYGSLKTYIGCATPATTTTSIPVPMVTTTSTTLALPATTTSLSPTTTTQPAAITTTTSTPFTVTTTTGFVPGTTTTVAGETPPTTITLQTTTTQAERVIIIEPKPRTWLDKIQDAFARFISRFKRAFGFESITGYDNENIPGLI